MNFTEVFQAAVAAAELPDEEMQRSLYVAAMLITWLPKDEAVFEKERQARQQCRAAGSPLVQDVGIPSDAALDDSTSEPSSDDDDSTSCSNLEKHSVYSRLFLNMTVTDAEKDVGVHQTRARQMEKLDESPTMWLQGVIVLFYRWSATQINTYVDLLTDISYRCSLRRKRIEQRCWYVRHACGSEDPASFSEGRSMGDEEAVQTSDQQKTKVAASTASSSSSSSSSTELTDCKNVGTCSAPKGFHISRKARQRIRAEARVDLSDLSQQCMQTCFIPFVETSLYPLFPFDYCRQRCTSVLLMVNLLSLMPRSPCSVIVQLEKDHAAQRWQLVRQWMEKAEGQLASLVAVRAEAPQQRGTPVEREQVRSMSSSTTIGDEAEEVGLMLERSPLITLSHEQADSASSDAAEESHDTHPPALAGPKTSRIDAIRLVNDFVQSDTPSDTALAHLTANALPEAGVTALLPCFDHPERSVSDGGFVRLSPCLTPTEQSLIGEWLQVALTELPDIDTESEEIASRRQRRRREVDLVQRWASPSYDPRGGELTVLLHWMGAVRLQLSNPCISLLQGMLCDMCCVERRFMSFQAVLERGVRNTAVLSYAGSTGYDLCVACAFYYFKTSERRLLQAVHPDPLVRRAYAFGRLSAMKVYSIRVRAAPETVGRATTVTGTALIVEIVMGLSPFGVVPVGWWLPRERLRALGDTCTTVSEATRMSEEVHNLLPVPPRDWQKHCSVLSMADLVGGHAQADGVAGTPASTIDDKDDCAICLQALRSVKPILRTCCGHHFHLQCIGSHYLYESTRLEDDVAAHHECPICRSPAYMPSITDAEAVMRTNLYRLQLHVPAVAVTTIGNADVPSRMGNDCAVAVGSILTEDGVYHNATNIAACEAFFNLVPGYAYDAAESPLPPPPPS